MKTNTRAVTGAVGLAVAAGLGVGACGATSTPEQSQRPTGQTQIDASQPVKIRHKINGVRVQPGTLGQLDAKGVTYASGTVPGPNGEFDTVHVWTGGSPESIISQEGGTQFLSNANPQWFIEGKNFIMTYVVPFTGTDVIPTPLIPPSTVAAQTSGHVVSRP